MHLQWFAIGVIPKDSRILGFQCNVLCAFQYTLIVTWSMSVTQCMFMVQFVNITIYQMFATFGCWKMHKQFRVIKSFYALATVRYYIMYHCNRTVLFHRWFKTDIMVTMAEHQWQIRRSMAVRKWNVNKFRDCNENVNYLRHIFQTFMRHISIYLLNIHAA